MTNIARHQILIAANLTLANDVVIARLTHFPPISLSPIAFIMLHRTIATGTFSFTHKLCCGFNVNSSYPSASTERANLFFTSISRILTDGVGTVMA